MFESIIKNYMFFCCCFFVFSKFIKIEASKNKFTILSLLSSLPLCVLCSYLRSNYVELSYFLPMIVFSVLVCILFNFSLKHSFLYSISAYGINMLCYEITLFAITVIISPFQITLNERNISLLTLISTFIYCLILIAISKLPRLRNNSILYHNKIFLLSVTVFSLLAILLMTVESLSTLTLSKTRLVRIAFIFFITFVLILWWRTQITKSYRERLRALEVESLRVSKQEQAEYISQLERENERMGRIIHKDNRIVNAMADSIGEYLQYSAYLSGNKLAEKGSSLQAQISEIRYDRQVLLDEKPATPTALPQTGYAGIDAMVTYMTKEASENKINFQFHYGEDFFTESGEDIKETDIVHLLSDSLENAIIATKFAGGKFIELSMLKIKGFPLISISDSGIPFELDTYMNLGLQKASTHLDTGGSGIGLMDLWELKEKYKATLYIDEHPEDANMTKRIVYIFDKKNRYMISTDRFKELQQKQTRADMFVINPNTEAVI